jgi:hypothetical protein
MLFSQVSVDRILALPLATNAMSRLEFAVRAASVATLMHNAETRAGAAKLSSAFSSFYSHLGGSARCYDIFDANDPALWAHSLQFSHIFVFPSAAHARHALDIYTGHLVPVAPLLLQVDDVEAAVTDSVIFRVWCAFRVIDSMLRNFYV